MSEKEKRYPFEYKTVKELAAEANKIYRENKDDHSDMTLEEAIEYDAEAGYDYYEDEEIELTREIVHSVHDEMPPCISCVESDFDDGTSYVAELWCENHVTFVTYYFSTENLANDEEEIEKYLIKVGKLIEGETHNLGIITIELEEPKPEEIYSVTVAVGDDDETFCEALL